MEYPRQEKPYEGFPLWWHKEGYWAKWINKTPVYFGERGGDWKSALDEYHEFIGGAPRDADGDPTVEDMCNGFMAEKDELQEEEFSDRSWREYLAVGKLIIDHFKKPKPLKSIKKKDFEKFRASLAKGKEGQQLAIPTLANRVRIARMFFNYANQELGQSILFQRVFREPSKRAKRRYRKRVREQNGAHMYSPGEIRQLLYTASPVWRAKIYLGINCGYGNTDLSELPISLVGPEIDYPRLKTGEDRRSILWPETLEAVQAAIRLRAEAELPEYDGRVFLTRQGKPWVRANRKHVNDGVAKEFAKLLERCGLKRPGVGFYALRHTFLTVAEQAKDKDAVKFMMGHVDPSMEAPYREEIEDDRLQVVVDHVRQWLCRIDKRQQKAEAAAEVPDTRA